MNLQNRIELLTELGKHLKSNPPSWQSAKQMASLRNPWFTHEFVEYAAESVIRHYLDQQKLTEWVNAYDLAPDSTVKKIGMVMAGNIPMVGIHDLISVFVSGHRQLIKLSSKDEVLMKYLIDWLCNANEDLKSHLQTSEQLKGCDAYICTGSAQTGKYFKTYFGKYPHIIRSNKTSVAILTGDETEAELSLLADDIQLFFGLGCRNVTQIFVPESYPFEPLLKALDKYQALIELDRYKNNYDFQLSILLLNQIRYMSNATTLLVESESPFSPISVLNYQHYQNQEELIAVLQKDERIQCIVGKDFVPFGFSQQPALHQYADGVDTLAFLSSLR